jgi:hypothetical protein
MCCSPDERDQGDVSISTVQLQTVTLVVNRDTVDRFAPRPLGKNAYTDFLREFLSRDSLTEITTTRAPRSKSVVRSFRLDEDVDKSLHKYALQEGISINSLVNKGLRRYVLWDIHASRFGGVTLAGASLTRIMNYLSDDEVREYAQWVADNSVRDFVTFFFGEVTLHTLLQGLKLLADYGGHFEYEESTSGRVRTVVLKHGRGMKWSIHYGEWVRLAVEKLLGLKVDIERTENQVIFRFPLPAGKEQGN